MRDMGALKDLWKSERGLVGMTLIVAITVLAALQQVTVEQWMTYSWQIFLTYAAAKTVTGTAALLSPAPQTVLGKRERDQAPATSPSPSTGDPVDATSGTTTTVQPKKEP